jgi:hypothetical protein
MVRLHRYNKSVVRNGMICMKLNWVMRNAGSCVHLAAVHSSVLNQISVNNTTWIFIINCNTADMIFTQYHLVVISRTDFCNFHFNIILIILFRIPCEPFPKNVYTKFCVHSLYHFYMHIISDIFNFSVS